MASWNGQNKRRKSKGFNKDRHSEELETQYRRAVKEENRKRDRKFQISIERELAEDAMEEELEMQESRFLINRHS